MNLIETEGTQLTRKQLEAIPHLIGARSMEEGRKLAKVGKRTIHRWLKEQAFKKELDTARERFVNEALDRLKSSVTRAVDVLSEAMTGTDAVLRVRAAGMVLDYFFRVKETQEFENRLKAVEEALEARGKARH